MNKIETSINWRHYTVGFCFSSDLNHVILIRKAKPQWQAGKLNGVGGSFEAGEDMFQCMEREFKEETTLDQKDWLHFGTGWYSCHQGPCAVHYLVTRRHSFDRIPIIEPEQPNWFEAQTVEELEIVGNLFWLIPMARLKILHPEWVEVGNVVLNF